ncbi:NADH dehydrogenase [ubiquinone] 1 alpha subcomplex assembly factor 3 [Austrofundulus limnaeus]|uniref:NADH dehydrogenase [ubiquinone] 1 alpha subcomplex assembly factor 3 n=1 Tax=Austrofundulus limnaeus TaxID=52670 RepID=A0A2I4B289_AUSLI|nr:PREDICTED: NADH dehydrogenase [ubiquinone] 1 alpha subcomplex assembly factor 3 [Austrofundulus limnaeus]
MAAAACSRLFQRSTGRILFSSKARSALSSPFLTRGHRLEPGDDELHQKSSISILKKEDESGTQIHSYSPTGFIIGSNQVFGPCALLLPAILQWNVSSHEDITEESVSLFHMIEPTFEILVLGTGARIEQIKPSVLALLRRKGIAVEVLDTPNACATFNFLNSERRLVAAGLIPPSVRSTAVDITQD